MAQRWLRRLLTIWPPAMVWRFARVHAPLGLINYGLAAVLHYYYGVNHHIATAVGHFFHVLVGFFIDRAFTYEAKETTVQFGMPKYIVTELLSYGSIVLSMYILVDLLDANVAISRGIVGMWIASIITFTLNRYWTFKYQTKQVKNITDRQA